jgi:predicted phage-related endonuclease
MIWTFRILTASPLNRRGMNIKDAVKIPQRRQIMFYQELLDRVPHISTDDMDYETWLEKRREGIGGSDAGAIMGFSGKYGSPLTVFLQKKGLEKGKEMSPAAKRGKLLEPLIRDWFAESYPQAIIESVPFMFSGPGEYPARSPLTEKRIIPPFMGANIDGLVYSEKDIEIGGESCRGLGGLEIKSSRDGFDFGEKEIPDSYWAQVQHYMAVLDLDWFIVSAAILSREGYGDMIRNYIIPRNNEFISELVERETAFWNDYVLADEWPAPMGIEGEEDMITGMFEGGSSLVLGDEERELCRKYRDAHVRYKESEEIKERISTEIKVRLVQRQSGNGEKKISAIAGPYSISWSRFERSDVDRDALKKAGLYEKFVKKSETGRLTISEKGAK